MRQAKLALISALAVATVAAGILLSIILIQKNRNADSDRAASGKTKTASENSQAVADGAGDASAKTSSKKNAESSANESVKTSDKTAKNGAKKQLADASSEETQVADATEESTQSPYAVNADQPATQAEAGTAETMTPVIAAAQTPATEIQPTAQDAQSAASAAQTAQLQPVSGQIGNIHELSQGELEVIRDSLSSSIVGYGGPNFVQEAANKQSYMSAIDAHNVRFFTKGSHVISLTFQEGWENGYTGQLLDILNAHGVKACFYVSHEYASGHPDLIRRMINEGHVVGSHTFSCPDEGIANWPLEAIQNDALQMQQYMLDTFGYVMTDYNINSGIYTDAACKMLSDMGYRVVLCSNSYRDFDASAAIDANEELQQMEAGMTDGSIYAFHVTNPCTIQMIGPLIEYAQANGYTIVTVE